MLDADETLDRASAPIDRKAGRSRTKTRDISWSAAITRRILKLHSRITWSGSFPTGRTIATAAAFMKPSTPRFWPEAGGC